MYWLALARTGLDICNGAYDAHASLLLCGVVPRVVVDLCYVCFVIVGWTITSRVVVSLGYVHGKLVKNSQVVMAPGNFEHLYLDSGICHAFPCVC